jgi:predicted Co/Zn/Cd cation transporter (cation efflux family)
MMTAIEHEKKEYSMKDSLPMHVPYDRVAQGPIIEVYAAVCNTTSNTSMVHIAQRIFDHIDQALNQADKISFHMLIFDDSTDTRDV